jgi:hypothetical protein
VNYLKTEAITNSRNGNFTFEESYTLPRNYELPLTKDAISNYENFSGSIHLNESAFKKLKNNVFVVIENPYNSREEYITSMYSTLKEDKVPNFITTDSLLHIYHIQFDDTLRQIEEKEFYDTLWKTDLALLNASLDKYNSATGNEKEASRRNVPYFSVALSLLQPKQKQVPEKRDINTLLMSPFSL